MSKTPPSYCDLGKSARDLFDKGFNYGFAKLDLKTKHSSGWEFATKGSSSHDSGKICGSIEGKYKKPSKGLTFTDKWTTDNTLSTEVSVEDQLLKGLKMTLCTSFTPSTGKKMATLKAAYKQDYMHINLDTDFNFGGPTLSGSTVIGYEGWLGGCEIAFDTFNSAITKNKFALGYTGEGIQLLAHTNGSSVFGASIFQSINKDLSTGVQLSYQHAKAITKFGVAAKFSRDTGVSYNAKVNNDGHVGLGVTQQMRDGIKLTLSSLVDGKNLSSGAHRLGLGLEFEV